jgi:hypothetical protein
MNKQELEVHYTLSEINKAWRAGNPKEMAPYLHPEIVMKFPGFKGEIIGRENFLSGFVEFCTNAKVLEYSESDEQINIIDNCAIISFQFEMLYERTSYRERSEGRDLWIFNRIPGKWLAVWRTMTDLNEQREIKD